MRAKPVLDALRTDVQTGLGVIDFNANSNVRDDHWDKGEFDLTYEFYRWP